MISQTAIASIAKIVATGGLIAASAGGIYLATSTRSDDTQRRTVTDGTPLPIDSAETPSPTAIHPQPNTIVVTDVSRLPVQFVSPKFSPDGQKVAGGVDGRLNIGSADGTNLGAVDEPDAAYADWSPDSKTLAVTTVHGGITTGRETANIVLISTDGSSRTEVGESDFPSYVQFYADGRLAYVHAGRLHLLDTTTGIDTTPDAASPIVNDVLASDIPFSVSPTGQFVATARGTVLSVQDLFSGRSQVITDSLRLPRWQPYVWSPHASVLAYADAGADRVPVLHLYDTKTAQRTAVLNETEANGGFYDVLGWAGDSSWLLFAFRPGGTENEGAANYQAFNTDTGVRVPLFDRGLGGVLSAGGHRLSFFRDPSPSGPAGTWVATLDFQ